MSLWTDYAENQFVDMTRGTAPTLPAVTWYIGLASVASDGSIIELTGANLARKNIARSLAAWAGTQAPGSTTASSGTSHTTSNNAIIQFAAAGGDLADDASYAVLYDAASAGNAWAYIPLPGAPLTVLAGDTPSIAAGALQLVVGDGNGCSDYLSNKIIDLWLRGQAYSWPANTYEALFSGAPSNAGGGTEISAGGYARVAVASSMAAWSGTQSSASTSASSGTSGDSHNIGAITFPSPTADYTIVAGGEYDASSSGNLLNWGLFDRPRSIVNGGSAPAYAAGQRVRSFL
jgi:hypothetical protein